MADLGFMPLIIWHPNTTLIVLWRYGPVLGTLGGGLWRYGPVLGTLGGGLRRYGPVLGTLGGDLWRYGPVLGTLGGDLCPLLCSSVCILCSGYG
jgi:hypothetical protein